MMRMPTANGADRYPGIDVRDRYQTVVTVVRPKKKGAATVTKR